MRSAQQSKRLFLLTLCLAAILTAGAWVNAQESLPKAVNAPGTDNPQASDIIPEGSAPAANTAAPAAPPAPAPDAPAPSDVAAPDVTAPPSTAGGNMESFAAAPATATAPSSDEYLIQKGDTLWDISARFFDKAEYWPKLWSYNQYITNPHFIYPGNRVVFKPGSETEPPSAEVVPGAQPMEPLAANEPGVEGKTPASTAPGMEGTPSEGKPADEVAEAGAEAVPGMIEGAPVENPAMGKTIALREDGYISTARESSLGFVDGSYLGVFNLSEYEMIYLRMKDSGQLQVGDLFTVFREEKRVRGLGYLNKVLGIVEVKEVKGREIKAMVKRSYYPIVRGDKIREYYNAIHQVQVQEPSNTVEGNIVERLNYETVDIGSGDVVYIDRGNRDGVEPGYEFLVLRRQDGTKGKPGGDYPEEIVGKLVVVVARGNNSTAVVTYSMDSLKLGDHISTQRSQAKN